MSDETRVRRDEIIRKHLGQLDKENLDLISEFATDLLKKCGSCNSFESFYKQVQCNGGEEFSKEFVKELYDFLRTEGLNGESTVAASSKEEPRVAGGLEKEAVKRRRESVDKEEEDSKDAIYEGRVISLQPYSVLIRFGKNLGKCHISEIPSVNGNSCFCPSEVLKLDQKVYFKILDQWIERGRMKMSLSMKGIDQSTGKSDSTTRSWQQQQRPQQATQQLFAFNTTTNKSNYFQNSNRVEDRNKSEVETGIELNQERPRFLQNKMMSSDGFNINSIISMDGKMSKLAANGSELAKKFREEKATQQKLKNKWENAILENDPLYKKEDKASDVIEEWKSTNNSKKSAIFSGKLIEQQRKSLPIYGMREELVEHIKNNQFLVIVGETGSGKTTQIVQYIYEEGLNKVNGEFKMIGCTQPRRVAATSVAKRVAEEVNCNLGDLVGYSVRFDDCTSYRTKIKYLTDGMLEREALSDLEMSKYAVIMLDEAHERTIATDVLFALLKQAALKNPNFKVLVTSATLDSEKFSRYFNNCPILKIPGRTFPVEILYTREPETDYLAAALDSVMQIHVSEPAGDILVFLTGQEEIDTSCEILADRVRDLGSSASLKMIILPVYAALPSELQSEIFEPAPPGSRKVILATNIAETSITIDGIYYVIDPGYVKLNAYDPRKGMDTLKICPISQAQANQRSGRAGRTGPGKCFRLYTEKSYTEEMFPNTVPEIQRQNLSHTILMLKAMGIDDLFNFEFMDPPSTQAMLSSLEDLYMLEALDEDGELTQLGRQMADFPMEPALAKTLIKSVEYGCTEEILSIVSMLSVQTIFFRPKRRRREADEKKARFYSSLGDHLTLFNVYQRWCTSNYSKTWCQENFIQERSMKKAKDVRVQLRLILQKYNYTMNSCGSDLTRVLKTLCCGYFKNTAKRYSTGYETLTNREVVFLHPSSSQFGKDPEYVLYDTLLLTKREYMHCVSVIEPQWLFECAPNYFKIGDPSQPRRSEKIVPLFSRSQNRKQRKGWKRQPFSVKRR
ncbi:PRP22 [Candida oxycetoniae]|uniref:RNA helicase n=1 Tax=Candida oxycetoniae TaxID=497107 RepID=A0AAI9SV10_9ASCO|nr:PRP22 [Candida oxycetoniae]KAI3403583.2 PRP22 [Candida oxycetoniae]